MTIRERQFYINVTKEVWYGIKRDFIITYPMLDKCMDLSKSIANLSPKRRPMHQRVIGKAWHHTLKLWILWSSNHSTCGLSGSSFYLGSGSGSCDNRENELFSLPWRWGLWDFLPGRGPVVPVPAGHLVLQPGRSCTSAWAGVSASPTCTRGGEHPSKSRPAVHSGTVILKLWCCVLCVCWYVPHGENIQ